MPSVSTYRGMTIRISAVYKWSDYKNAWKTRLVNTVTVESENGILGEWTISDQDEVSTTLLSVRRAIDECHARSSAIEWAWRSLEEVAAVAPETEG